MFEKKRVEKNISAFPPSAGHQLSLTSAGHQLSLYIYILPAGHQLSLNIYIYIYILPAGHQLSLPAGHQLSLTAGLKKQLGTSSALTYIYIYIVVVLIIIIIIIISITICFCAVLESIQSCAAAILALVFFKQATPNEFTECNHGWPNIETTYEPGSLCAGASFS